MKINRDFTLSQDKATHKWKPKSEYKPIYDAHPESRTPKQRGQAFAGNMYKNVKDPNLVCALTGHKEGSKAFNRYRMIDEETNRQTMSYLE